MTLEIKARMVTTQNMSVSHKATRIFWVGFGAEPSFWSCLAAALCAIEESDIFPYILFFLFGGKVNLNKIKSKLFNVGLIVSSVFSHNNFRVTVIKIFESKS